MIQNKLTADEEILFKFFSHVHSLSLEDFEPIRKVIKRKSFNKGDFILNIGQVETKSSFIVKGIVHQYVLIENRQFTIDISLSGMSFNCFTSYVENTPSEQIQEAITNVEILYLEKADAEILLLQSSAFCYVYNKLYEQVHLEREKRSLLLQHKSSSRRYEQFFKTITKARRFTEDVPQKMIADYLNITQETFSRVKKEYLKKS